MLSTLLKLVILYYVIKLVIDRLVPKLKVKSSRGGVKTNRKDSDIKRFEGDEKQVKEAEFDEL